MTSDDSLGGGRLHRGDIMSPEKRSAVMARIKGRGTKPELAVAAMLDRLAVTYETHARDLPGRPDFVVRERRLAILVDGDFWHGWRFDAWRLKLSPEWERKIAANIRRDTRNRLRLRQAGWTVLRIWEHSVSNSPSRTRARLRRALGGLSSSSRPGNLSVHQGEQEG